MQNLANEKAAAGHKWLRAGIASGVAIALLAIYLGQPEESQPGPSVPAAQSGTLARFGPGEWTGAASQEPSPAVAPVAADTSAPGGLAITADNRLVVNKALRNVADYFLLGGHPGTRASHVEKLLSHLRAALPGPAFDEAASLVRKYVNYLDSHDKLLERESMPQVTADSAHSPADLDRIGAWLSQRSRLRQDLLGLEVAKIWFGEEEEQDLQVLAAMRQYGSKTPPLTSPDPQQLSSAGWHELREKNASYQAQREYVLSQFGEQAAQRFDAIEGKEQTWKIRYASYRQTVENILRQPGIDAAERVRLIASLRAQTFETEQERLRAENLDALPPPKL